MKLTDQEKLKYSRILFNSQGRIRQQIRRLTQQQLQIFRNIYAQKIAYQLINGKIEYYRHQDVQAPQRTAQMPSVWESLFCICYPSKYQQDFDITSSVFLQRVFYPFFFWNDGFFNIREDMMEYYGFVWICLTYSIVLGLSSTLSSFFVHPTNFQIQYWNLVQCIGLVYIYKSIQIILFQSAVGCLGGDIYSIQTVMAVGYSLMIYIVPTILCVAPSLYWHVIMNVLAMILRTIFLGRNFSKKIESRLVFVYLAVLINELIYMFLVLRIMFGDDSGYTFYEGFVSIFGPSPQIDANQTQTASKENHFAYLHLRHTNETI